MKKINHQYNRYSIFKFIILAGLVLIFYSCTGLSSDIKDGKNELDFEDEFLHADLIREYKSTYAEFSEQMKDADANEADNADKDEEDIALLKEIGKLNYNLGNLEKDRKKTNKAIKIFKRVLRDESENTEILAYLGSAYLIKSRDFPAKWIVNITPVGFVRLYYLKKGYNYLNKAVLMDAYNPVLRLIRGGTYSGLPKGFNNFQKGIKDLELLQTWVEDSTLNTEYQAIITSDGFKASLFYYSAEAYLKTGDKEKADSMFRMMAELDPDIPYVKAAKRYLDKN